MSGGGRPGAGRRDATSSCVIAKTASARSAPRKRRVALGLRSSEMSAFEPASTAEQKKSVAPVPKTPLVGTA